MSEIPTPQTEVQNLFKQVDSQLDNHQIATVLVERTNGDITTAQIAAVGNLGRGETAAFFSDNRGKPVGNERLTDEYQEHLAEKLAGAALRGAEQAKSIVKESPTVGDK